LPRLHVRPPSTVLPRVPLGPGANAELGTCPERIRVNLPTSRPPIGRNVAPVSSETTVEPCSPVAARRVGDANAAARIGSVDGVGNAKGVSPPSVVMPSCVPCWVVMTQTLSVAQATDVRFCGPLPPIGLATHVAPPSLVFRNSD
jgi:hypothetical protein